MANRSYIPSTLAARLAWAVNFSALLVATPTAYGLVAGDVSSLAAKTTAYETAANAVLDPATVNKTATAAKDTAERIFFAYARPLALRVASNPAITDELKTGLGVTIRNSMRPRVPAPTTFPILAYLSTTPLQAQLAFADSATPLIKAKPFGAVAMQLFASVGTVQPAGPEACPFVGIQTRTPFVMDFEQSQVGKTAWVYARWVTRKGLLGPWSSAVQFTVGG